MRNPTIEPARKQQHQYILDRQDGSWLTLHEFMGDGDYGDVIAERRVGVRIEIAEGQDRYVCPACEKPMILASHRIQNRSKERFYFKHLYDDGSCSGIAGLGAKTINAMRFAQTKESVEHHRLKAMILASIEHDPAFTDTLAERRWVDIEGESWRQPDIQSRFNGQRVAFEVQLSTTFLHVIVERMRFYQRNDGRLLWLFRDLDAEHFRLAEQDIFFSNNRNAFRVTEQTVALSRAHKHFLLECVWHEPCVTDGRIETRLAQRIVRFDELKFDVSDQGAPRTYFFDYESEKVRSEQELIDRKRVMRDQEIRQSFESFYLPFLRHELTSTNIEERWPQLVSLFQSLGLALPEHPFTVDGPYNYLVAAYSAREGVPVGLGYGNLVQVAHYLVDKRKETLWVFRLMLEAHDRANLMREYDTTQRWRQKVTQYRDALRREDPEYMPNRAFDRLLSFLFPEISEKLVMAPRQLLGEPRTAQS
jgi:competence CoiA-like predicted nuclease|tara:strand:+ start:195 stop:1625 length:1431 start_codon:yes stop_codon:yes gene_type:complete